MALSLIALLHFVADEDGAHDLVSTLVDALAPGSALVLTMMTADFEPERAPGHRAYAAGGVTLVARSHDEVAAFFQGLDLLEPGITSVARWRPGDRVDEKDGPVSLYGGVARKPDGSSPLSSHPPRRLATAHTTKARMAMAKVTQVGMASAPL